MSEIKQQAARAFAFSGATLLTGTVVYFFTQGLAPYIHLPDIAGSVFALGFILIFLNISFALGRRFCSQSFIMEFYPFVLGFILITPSLVLSWLTGLFSETGPWLYYAFLLVLSSLAGSWLGIRSGRKKRDRLISQAIEDNTTSTRN